MNIFPEAYDVADFTTDLTANVGATITNVGPLVALVAGLALAFAVVPWIISLIKKVRSSRA